jgi:alpha-tubulin suppressor-like RCC1 family protein
MAKQRQHSTVAGLAAAGLLAVVLALVVGVLGGSASAQPAAVAREAGAGPASTSSLEAPTVVAGGTHSCALAASGSVRCWGWNGFGQLGLGDVANRGDGPGEMHGALPAVALGTGRTATSLAAGRLHTCAVLDDGSVRCWGMNQYGQLGVGDTDVRGDEPGEMGDALPVVDVGTGRTATALTAGYDHTCALLDDGSVRCWGSNGSGQLGLDEGLTDPVGDEGGEVGDALVDVDLGAGRTATAISAGGLHTCALLDDGSLRCWGRNDFGQLGLEDAEGRGDQSDEMGDALPTVDLGPGHDVAAIAAGENHTCAVLDDGSLRCWGDNTLGTLGLGITGGGEGGTGLPVGDEPGEMGAALPPVDLGAGHEVTAITGGQAHTCALLDDRSLRCWGANGEGQLGLGDTTSRGRFPEDMGDELPAVDLGTGRTAVAVVAGGSHTCAVLDDGSTRCWGWGGEGRLGLGDELARGDEPGEMGDALPAVGVPGPPTPGPVVAAGSGFSCALMPEGSVRCWGSGSFGRLGDGQAFSGRGWLPNEMGVALPEIDLGTGRTATALTVGDQHACALLDDGAVRCWGRNLEGQLGLGDQAARGDDPGEMGDALPTVDLGVGRTAVSISAGGNHTCAVLDDGSVRCWGMNGSAELGLGDTEHRGDEEGEMGDDLPAVDLGTGRTATALAPGSQHTCALLDDDSLRCWGSGLVGALGVGDDQLHGDEPGEMGDDLPVVDLGPGRTVEAVSAGGNHTCAVLDDGSLRCWGQGEAGALGLGDVAMRGDGPGEMGAALPPVDLGPGRTVVRLELGTFHSCAVLDDGSLRCWGSGWQGELGLGSTDTIGDGPGEMGAALPPVDLGDQAVVDVTAGDHHTCATLHDGSVRCWGEGGVIGLGDGEHRGDGPGEMGAALPPVDLATWVVHPIVQLTGPAMLPAGDELVDELTVTNPGADQLTGLTATSDSVDCDDLPATLDPGETVQVECAHPTVVADIGTYVTTATVDADQTLPVASNQVQTSVFFPPATVFMSGPASAFAGDVLQYGISVTNEALFPMTSVLLDDPYADCGVLPTTIAVGATAQVTCTHTTDEASYGGYFNQAEVEYSGTSSSTNAVNTQVWQVSPTGILSGPATAEVGDVLEYELEIRNEGALGMWDVTIESAKADCDTPPATIDAGASAMVACSHTTTVDDVGTYQVQMTIDSYATLPTASGRVDTQVTIPEPTVVKSGPATVAAGDDLEYEVEVTNEAAIELTGVTLTDDKADCDDLPSTIDAGETESVDCTYTSQLSDVGTYTNSATVDSDQTDTVASNEVSTTVTPPAGDPQPPTVVQTGAATAQVGGGPIEYEITVTNQAAIWLTGVTLSDPNATCVTIPTDINPGGGFSASCTHDPVAADVGTYTNVATLDTDQFDPVTSNPVHTTVSAMAADQLPTVTLVGPPTATVGDHLAYGVVITNNASSTLTGTSVAVPDADCGPFPTSVALGQTAVADCLDLIEEEDVGTISNAVTFTSVQTGPLVSDPVQTTVSPVPPTFTDVPWDHVFFEDVEWMALSDISEGYADGTYRPSAPVTRQAMSAFLYRLAGSPPFVAPASPSFTDVGSTHPFFAEVEWMAAEGISEGYAGNRFRPAEPVSRQAMSAFLYRLAGSPTFVDPPVATFVDVGFAHPFSHEVEWMASEDIADGFLDGTFRPGTAVSRQAMSAFLHRLANGPGVDLD